MLNISNIIELRNVKYIKYDWIKENDRHVSNLVE